MKRFISLTLLLALVPLATATRAQEKSPLQAMVDTERAFAKMSEDQGVRPAFMAFIADDGILFRPTAVKGKQWMTEHPVPPSDKQPVLSWYPAAAGIARAGDLGYTTGPWEFRSDSHNTKAVVWGHFLTVWKKQADGEWKFAIDLGISHPQPDQAEAPWQLPPAYQTPQPLRGRFWDNAAALLARDREFSQASLKHGARAAFAAYALPEVRLYREGKFPLRGTDLAPAVLPDGSGVWTWEPAAGDASNSDDLGYTYGSYKISNGGPSPAISESGNYFRIWRKDGSTWKVLFDLTNPIPPTKN
jgi:ketosteroid isomerase-like protein